MRLLCAIKILNAEQMCVSSLQSHSLHMDCTLAMRNMKRQSQYQQESEKETWRMRARGTLTQRKRETSKHKACVRMYLNGVWCVNEVQYIVGIWTSIWIKGGSQTTMYAE